MFNTGSGLVQEQPIGLQKKGVWSIISLLPWKGIAVP